MSEIQYSSIVEDIKSNVRRARFSRKEIENYLIFNYFKGGISKLSDKELLEFQAYCQSLPSHTRLKIEPLNLTNRLKLRSNLCF